MGEKTKKWQIAKISIFITSIFVIFISITYAFITQTLTGTKQVVINAGVLDLVLEEENEITISDALPMYDEVGMIQEDVFIFRLVNKTNNPTNYILKMSKIEADNELLTSDVKYYLTKEGVGEPALLSTLPTDGTIDSGVITGNDTIDYTLRLWIDFSVTDQTTITGKSLSYKLSVEVSQEVAKLPAFVETLEDKVDTATIIDFSSVSSETNGEGIYKYQEDGVDVYYWRGDVSSTDSSDNHVLFAGICWEMVRTTKTGGIKMIYDGTPTEVDGVLTCSNTGEESQLSTSVFNSDRLDNAYVGYMYGLTGVTSDGERCLKLNSAGTAAEVGTEITEAECAQAGGKWATTGYEATHANVVNSTIKTAIDTWFSTSSLNIEENLAKIEDAVYCNDRSIDTISGYGTGLGYGTNQTAYNARYRLSTTTDRQPILECANKNDRFTVSEDNGNGDLTYPIGLLTADEIALAGGVYGTSNSDYYLYTGQYYWTLSPSYNLASSSYNFLMNYDGRLTDNRVHREYGVRPVVSLVAETTFVEGGTGTETNPYVVQ